MTYFHTGTRTIIGADLFHCPVRDGKEWFQVAMVIRHKLLLHWPWLVCLGPAHKFIESFLCISVFVFLNSIALRTNSSLPSLGINVFAVVDFSSKL